MGAKMIRLGRQSLVVALFQLLLFTSNASAADPTSVTIAGTFQSELGCPGDWQPGCAATHLVFNPDDQVWQATFSLPAGDWEYKAALNDSWDENYGANATLGGANIPLSLAAPGTVKFYYSPETHWVTDNHQVIAVAAGSFQSELGCPGDWQPDCLLSWLQDPDGDGIYTLTRLLPAGNYEVKVAINESWVVNYGAKGVQNGPNIPFTVPPGGGDTLFSYDSFTHILTVAAENQPPVAKCKDVIKSAGPSCEADASINNGSFDPDAGDTITLVQSPAGPYSLGSTLVTLTVTDSEGASSQCAGTVTVVDNTPPRIKVSASPSMLWPPNHQMVPVRVTINAFDNCGGPPQCKIVSVKSNEPVNGLGDGDTAPDWLLIARSFTVNLRAERSGKGSGRYYTVGVQCSDDAGNTSVSSVQIKVPHDQREINRRKFKLTR